MNSTIEFLPDYVILDLETTGFSPETDKIIEYGLIKVFNGKIVKRIRSYINPGIHISRHITDLTGISDDTVRNSPTIDEAKSELMSEIGYDLIIGHNIKFDISFLESNLGIHITNEYIDTLDYCKELYPGVSHSLEDMAKALEIEFPQSHEALADCEAVYNLIKAIERSAELKEIIPPKKKNYHVGFTDNSKSLQMLQGIIFGIVCDNVITDDEIAALNNWLLENKQLSGNYPYDIIFNTVSTILEDGIVTEEEREQFLMLLKERTDPVSTSGNEVGDVELSGKTVCLSGDFDLGPKSEFAAKLACKGAIVKETVTKQTDILIVGGSGSESWAYGNYGNKVKKALEMQEKGHRIIIIKESEIKI